MDKLLAKTLDSPLNFGPEYQNKTLINTINAHSYNVAQKDQEFYRALMKSDILIPDGVGVQIGYKFLTGKWIKKISAYDLFEYEMKQLMKKEGKCFFLGSSEKVLELISERARVDFPHVKVKYYSPPYRQEFSPDDNLAMINAVNAFEPDVLFVGMTAPKQEKWSAAHLEKLNVKHVCCIGAVFDFYAKTIKRAPKWMIALGLEWFYRLIREPRRMWRRYVVGNPRFTWLMIKERFSLKNN